MNNGKRIEQFCGIDLYAWENWDLMDTDMLYFYNVGFLVPSMQKYNGMDVERKFDGKMEIYGRYGTVVVWSGWVTDIPEVIEELNKRCKVDSALRTK